MSVDTEATSNRKAALENLKFSKVSKLRATSQISPSSSSSSTGTSQAVLNAPPIQSRDATVPSRYFPSTPTAITQRDRGTVLVPNSSPLGPDSDFHSYQRHHPPMDYDNDSIPGFPSNVPSVWGQSSRSFAMDPLTAPSGFIPQNGHTHASFQQSYGSESRRISDVDGVEEGPPRKRIHRGSDDPLDFLKSPGSPEVLPLGQRRRIGANTGSTSSDESMPDVAEAVGFSSKPRIMRGRRPDTLEHTPSTPETPQGDTDKFLRFKLTMPTFPAADIQAAWDQANGNVKRATDLLSDPTWDPRRAVSIPETLQSAVDPNFTRFKLTMPMYDAAHIQAAWVQANRDVKKATDLLSDPTWDPKPPPPPPSHAVSETTGRVRELDEATKAQRQAAREKGKMSMIYANRPVLESKPISQTSAPTTSSAASIAPSSSLKLNHWRPPPRKLPSTRDSSPEVPKSDAARVLEYFNTKGPEGIQELTGCTVEQALKIIELRPFQSVNDLNLKLGQGKKKAGPAGISSRMFDDCTAIFEEYGKVDDILEGCENIGASLRAVISSWTAGTSTAKGKEKDSGSSDVLSEADQAEDGALSLRSLTILKERQVKDFLVSQPSLLSDTVQLKEYQLLGVNWLNLLYQNRLSAILADEMGLGKTIQVISFFAHLKEQGSKGPHLVVVPSSTLENWCREFSRFAPSISFQTYYAGKEERSMLRQNLLETQRSTNESGQGWEVLITTYNLAQGDDRDRKFFRRIEWDCCVFDEGHVLKNFQSQRYQALLKYESNWRLLLTGTPLQNNLQELVSLMNFILPGKFAGSLDSLRTIFRTKGDSKVTLLSQERISRAKKMMTPFVLRRRKDQVLKDLPKKVERIEWCEMTEIQKSIYNDALQRSRKTIFDLESTPGDGAETPPTNGRGKPTKKKPRANARGKDKVYLENSSNVLMDLRKAASHPMLFRTLFTDQTLNGMTKQLLKEPDFKKRGALFELVKEDMEVMTDAELQLFAASYKSTQKFLQDEKCYIDAGKITVLLKLLAEYREEGRKVLIFSQFTQILDILQAILKQKDISYLLLTGSTPVDVRQSLVDDFTEDETIPVFLLSTKAGGMGINLTAASVVIMFDQDFNPHNDKQAQDRAYRIGQKRNVEVIKLITRGTIEEDMLKLGQTKLALDEAVAGDTEEGDKGESAPEREMKTSLMNVLRKQLEQQQDAADSMDISRASTLSSG